MIDRCHCGVTHNAIELGGVIIVVDGERAFMHHGGYRDGEVVIYAPIEVPWRVEGRNMTISLRGWSCRIMQVIETAKARYFSVLAMSIWTTDGEFTISWIDEPVKTDTVTVVHAAYSYATRRLVRWKGH